MSTEPAGLELRPIGYIRSPKNVKFAARHQPAADEPGYSVLELRPEAGYREALRDLAGFSRIWLVWWFHLNDTWRPLVLPPRGPARRRGVFATRSPHRPNPLGLTAVELVRIDGLRLILGPCDLVDGTPVFDIKPYIPAYDAFPGERAGWLDEVESTLQAAPRFTVSYSALATEQCAWLRAGWEIDFRPRLEELLARDPSPHRGRRIRPRPGGRFEIGCGGWRALFAVDAAAVTVLAVGPAYPDRWLHDPSLERVPDREAQVAFRARWPEGNSPDPEFGPAR